jgi:hypothetical protein
VHPLGQPSLDAPDLLGVKGELKDVRRLARPRELRVGDVVRAIGLPLDEVRVPDPPVMLEGGLVHDLHTRPDRRLRLSRIGGRRDLPSLRPQLLEVGGLVLLALAANEIGLRVVDGDPSELAAGDRQLERAQMLTLEEVVEARRGEAETMLDLHATEYCSEASLARGIRAEILV